MQGPRRGTVNVVNENPITLGRRDKSNATKWFSKEVDEAQFPYLQFLEDKESENMSYSFIVE